VNPAALARALTLVENQGPGWEKVLATAAKKAKPAARLGITGPPGAGKSTLVARLVPLLSKGKDPVGVIAVDPSSQFTGGALLGDRFRFDPKAAGPGVFFRSVAHRGAEGGLALAVRAMVTLLETAGKRWVVLESLGVGQGELDILGLVDTVVVVLVPESGDYIQALKAGIMEAGDILVVNKMDREGAILMRDELVDVLTYSKARRFPGWEPRVLMTDARDGQGVPELLDGVRAHRGFLAKEGRLEALHRTQAGQAVGELFHAALRRRVAENPRLSRALSAAGARVAARRSDPYSEAMKLVGDLFKGGRS
jgi:LAO/AO transport system kinase